MNNSMQVAGKDKCDYRDWDCPYLKIDISSLARWFCLNSNHSKTLNLVYDRSDGKRSRPMRSKLCKSRWPDGVFIGGKP